MEKILVIDDNKSICKTIKNFFTQKGFDVFTAFTGEEGRQILHQENPSLTLLDIKLPDTDGITLLSRIKEEQLDTTVVIITGHQEMQNTIDAMRLGVYDYIQKPLDIYELSDIIEKAIHNRKLQKKYQSANGKPRAEFKGHVLIGRSKKMTEIFKLIGLASKTRAPVLIQGESGTGKELIAKAIYINSDPEEKTPFVAINCSAMVETLLESEMFGHEKGSFTGALYTKKGKLEFAHEGTLFLDEIGDMSNNLQSKLLRVLQEKEFERVGGHEKIYSNFRLISATNQDLYHDVKTGRFREDLFYRLNVIRIEVPPLRERREDIPDLVNHLLKKITTDLGKDVRISEEALKVLQNEAFPWEGNVRELENILTRAVALAKDELLNPESLPFFSPPFHFKKESKIFYQDNQEREIKPLAEILAEVEKIAILKTLDRTHWNLGQTCEALKISRPTLRQRLKEYGLRKPSLMAKEKKEIQ